MLEAGRIRLGPGLILIGLAILLETQLATATVPHAGLIVNLFGQVEVKAGDRGSWQPAQLRQPLFAGDCVRTGPASGAAILCADESQIKLNENSLLELRQVAPSERLRLGDIIPAAAARTISSLYQVERGEIWLRNKNERFRFELETPAVTAAIRGTEFNLQVALDGTSILTLVEGTVQFVNQYGSLALTAGEEGLARPGQAPTKRVVVSPTDAVQWALYYPGIFNPREIPLKLTGLPGASPPVEEAVKEYNQGNLPEAQRLVTAILACQPRNPAALTLQGWLLLQQQDLAGAAQVLAAVSPGNDYSLVGRALATYRLRDQGEALQLLEGALRAGPPSPLIQTMVGYLALVAGQPHRAQRHLEAAAAAETGGVLAPALLVQLQLAQNRQEQARDLAKTLVIRAPHSPLAWLSLALVKIASFELPQALEHLQQAVNLDPKFVEAYLYLAKIWLASDYLDKARQAVQRALELAPHSGEVLALAGFVRLAYRDFAEARRLFLQAAALSPGLGEPHLGLGIIAFHFRQPAQGLTAILQATLLEPRVSLYQAELGKALYQMRQFTKALEVYDYAKTLDPQDPTPYLYKGIALTDLNRPGEAIQEINQSIALNDHRGVYRTRLALNRDLAVRNYNLAKAYLQLNLQEWGFRKAVTAVQKDPTNASAYLFLSGAFAASRNRLSAGLSALLLYRLLSPANENTFTQGLQGLSTLDYTPMFEAPYFRVLTQGSAGCWPGRQAVTENFLEVYGGLAGLAFDAAGFYNENQGFRAGNGGQKNHGLLGQIKWEPTVKTSLYGAVTYYAAESGDTSNLTDASYQPSPYFRQYYRNRNYELGYVYRFNPQATLLVYATYQNQHNHSFDYYRYYFTLPPFGVFTVDEFTRRWLPREFYNLQAQQQLVLGRHNFLLGVDYFAGHLKYRRETLSIVSFAGIPIVEYLDRYGYKPPDRSLSFYLLDYWQPHQQLLVEAGVFKDYAQNSRTGFAAPVSNSLWSFRLGLNFFASREHTLRFLVQRNLNTHYFTTPSLVPPQVAGFPWQINIDEGGLTREIGLAWEAQWTSRTFTVLQLNAHRIDNPVFEPYLGPGGEVLERRVYWGWKRYLASLSLNQILSPAWGLSAGAIVKKVDPSFGGSDPTQRDVLEMDAGLTLTFLHPRGWQGALRNYLLYQDIMGRGDNCFWLADVYVGKALPAKRGLISLEINNIFDRRFYYVREPVALEAFFPSRRILFKLALFF